MDWAEREWVMGMHPPSPRFVPHGDPLEVCLLGKTGIPGDWARKWFVGYPLVLPDTFHSCYTAHSSISMPRGGFVSSDPKEVNGMAVPGKIGDGPLFFSFEIIEFLFEIIER
jgi:hypothetical protein